MSAAPLNRATLAAQPALQPLNRRHEPLNRSAGMPGRRSVSVEPRRTGRAFGLGVVIASQFPRD